MSFEGFDFQYNDDEFQRQIVEMPFSEAVDSMRERCCHLLAMYVEREKVEQLWRYMTLVEEARACVLVPDPEAVCARLVSIKRQLLAMLEWPISDLTGYCNEVDERVSKDGLYRTLLSANTVTAETLETLEAFGSHVPFEVHIDRATLTNAKFSDN